MDGTDIEEGLFNSAPLDGIEIKTEEEINAMTKKADVIAYAESIGLNGLDDNNRLDDLKAAVLNFQGENYDV